jgi:hypothetical protein
MELKLELCVNEDDDTVDCDNCCLKYCYCSICGSCEVGTYYTEEITDAESR